jgi:hypothetical protein
VLPPDEPDPEPILLSIGEILLWDHTRRVRNEIDNGIW